MERKEQEGEKEMKCIKRLLTIVLTATFVLSSIAQAGLIAHWQLDDNADSTTVTDSTGSNPGAAQQNTSVMHVSSAAENLGSALTFNGSNDYINCGSSATWQNVTASTVLLWMKATTSVKS